MAQDEFWSIGQRYIQTTNVDDEKRPPPPPSSSGGNASAPEVNISIFLLIDKK